MVFTVQELDAASPEDSKTGRRAPERDCPTAGRDLEPTIERAQALPIDPRQGNKGLSFRGGSPLNPVTRTRAQHYPPVGACQRRRQEGDHRQERQPPRSKAYAPTVAVLIL